VRQVAAAGKHTELTETGPTRIGATLPCIRRIPWLKKGVMDQTQDHLPGVGGLSFRTASSPNSSVRGILCWVEVPIGYAYREGYTKVAVGALLTLEIPSTANCLRIRWAPIHAI
jgi:hypothetical protein